MMWPAVALVGYFCSALSKIIDKGLLARTIPDPRVYTVWTGILSSFIVLLAPFGFHLLPPKIMAWALLSGVAFGVSLYCFYTALQRFEVSRVVPLFVGIAPFITITLSAQMLGERVDGWNVGVFALLIIGGVLLAWEGKRQALFSALLGGLTLAAAFALSVHFVSARIVFDATPSFINGLIWTRFGLILFALSFTLLPSVRRALRGAKRPARRGIAIFGLNKLIGATGLFLINLALAKMSVSLVHALGSFEYLFAFLLAGVLSYLLPQYKAEDFSRGAALMKLSGVAALGVASYLLFIA
ncbi:MAG: DMT family transporter [Candidatus Ryanbacteria bacterium]|nr:DMT family transporter [Candidatus Ryanbacteria bacterium]